MYIVGKSVTHLFGFVGKKEDYFLLYVGVLLGCICSRTLQILNLNSKTLIHINT